METQYILPVDKKEYNNYFTRLLHQLSPINHVVPLYHYTSGERLIQIIEQGELWSTQIACLNDSKELIHASEQFREVIANRQAAPINKDYEMLLGRMDELLSDIDHEAVSAFVICFSELGNDLSQWRAYGGVEGGFRIEFDCIRLRYAAAKKSALLLPVIYDEVEKNKLLSGILDTAHKHYMKGLQAGRAPNHESWANEFAQFWLWNLTFLAPALKHSAFSAEKEWRFIYNLTDNDIPQLRFKQRQTMVSRHLPQSLNDPKARGQKLLPITNIMVGPTEHQRLSQIAIGDLLKQNGYGANVTVTSTDIPFRTAH